jgi:hypothetical protein
MINTINLNTPCIIHLCEKKNTSCESIFDTTMLETVDEIFSSFGNSCKQAIYFQLKNTFKIQKQEIPLRIEDFANALEQLFGVGAKFIELKIIESLHKKAPNFVYSPHIKDIVFPEYVVSLRRFFLITNCKDNKCQSVHRKRNAPQLLQSTAYFLSS